MTHGVRMLAMARLEPEMHFIDLRLGEFRDSLDPGKRMAFDSPPGRELCGLLGVVRCPSCGLHVIAPANDDGEPLR